MNATSSPATQTSPRRRWFLLGTLGVLVVITALIVFNLGGKEEGHNDLYEVTRQDFLVTIVEGGTLDAVKEVVIRNDVEGSSRIIYIVPEGSTVTNGQLLVELDTGEAEQKLNEQEISYEKAKATLIQAEKTLEIEKSVSQSAIDAAQLKVVFAEIELDKFEKGLRLQELRNAEIDITTANSKLLLAQDTLEWSKKLYEQGFETKNTVDQGDNEVLNLTLQLEKARTNLWVLTNFDHPKNRKKFESDVEEAGKELERAIAQSEGKMAGLYADLITQSNSLSLIERKLKNDREQMERSKIYAPQDGLVVYAISRGRFSSESLIEEGAQVRNRQEIIKLPDTSSMKVTINVHESHVSKVSPGQKAFVVLDSLPDQRFKAEVTKVGLLPDSQERFGNPNLKVYKTEVRIMDPLFDVKPGVSARAEIIITNIPNAISVPIQSVTSYQGKPAVFVQRGSSAVPVPVEVGMFNTKYIEIASGLNEGDHVLLSPPFDKDQKDMGGAIIDEEETLSKEDITPSARPPSADTPREGRPFDDGSTSRRGAEGRPGGQTAEGQGTPDGGGGNRPQGSREDFIKRFDTNGDGQIDDTEREAIRAQFGRGGGGGGGGGDRTGEGGSRGGRRGGQGRDDGPTGP